MTQRDESEWSWYASSDEETYQIGPCPTRGQAIQEARTSEVGYNYDTGGIRFHVIEARKEPLQLSQFVDVEDMLVRADESAVDEHGNEDGETIFDLSGADIAEIEKRVVAALDLWQRENKKVFRGWSFTETRNGEWIEEPGR